LSLSESVNPPSWVRIIGLVFLPIGFFGAPVAYSVARSGEGRAQGRLGLLIELVGLAAFIALLIALG
jgi:Na+/serine symporter